MTIDKIGSARKLADFCFANMEQFPFHVQAHKDGTVSIFLVPQLDARFPKRFFVPCRGGTMFTREGRAYMDREWPNLRGAKRVPLEKAKRMLQKMRCKATT